MFVFDVTLKTSLTLSARLDVFAISTMLRNKPHFSVMLNRKLWYWCRSKHNLIPNAHHGYKCGNVFYFLIQINLIVNSIYFWEKTKKYRHNVVKLMWFSELLYGKVLQNTLTLISVLQQMTIKLLLVFSLINYTTGSVLCASHRN